MIPGRLIAVEGTDGSGKSTQIRLLYEWLKGQGLKAFFTEWNSSDLIRGATRRGKKEAILTPTTFSLMHAADFMDRYERQILPMLKAGYIVLADRYLYTALARDGVRDCPEDWILNLYRDAVSPDLVLYYRAPLEVALDRILRGRPQLKFYEAGMDLDLAGNKSDSFRIFQQRSQEIYDGLAPRFDFVTIDATRDIHSMQQQTRKAVTKRIDLKPFRHVGVR